MPSPIDPKKPITQPSMPSVPRPAGSYSSVGRPEDKDTREVEVPPAWAVALSERVAKGFQTTNANIEAISNDLGVVKDRVQILEKFRNETEERTRKHSGGIARISTSDASQNTVLSNLLVKVAETDDRVAKLATTTAAIEIKTDAQTRTLGTISDAVSGFAREHPIVVTSICTLIVSACTYVTQWLAAKGH